MALNTRSGARDQWSIVKDLQDTAFPQHLADTKTAISDNLKAPHADSLQGYMSLIEFRIEHIKENIDLIHKEFPFYEARMTNKQDKTERRFKYMKKWIEFSSPIRFEAEEHAFVVFHFLGIWLERTQMPENFDAFQIDRENPSDELPFLRKPDMSDPRVSMVNSAYLAFVEIFKFNRNMNALEQSVAYCINPPFDPSNPHEFLFWMNQGWYYSFGGYYRFVLYQSKIAMVAEFVTNPIAKRLPTSTSASMPSTESSMGIPLFGFHLFVLLVTIFAWIWFQRTSSPFWPY